MIHVTREYLSQLRAAVGLMFALAEEDDVPMDVLSKRARLGLGTLYALRSGKTRLPQFRTITQLARAVGCEISVERRTIRMRNASPGTRARRAV